MKQSKLLSLKEEHNGEHKRFIVENSLSMLTVDGGIIRLIRYKPIA